MAETITDLATSRPRGGGTSATPSFLAAALLVVAGGVGFFAATTIASNLAPLALIALSIGFFTIGALAFGVRVAQSSADLRWVSAFSILHNKAVEPALLTDLSGAILRTNLAARALIGGDGAARVHELLPGGEDEIEANVYQIIREARQKGCCRREAFRSGDAIYDTQVTQAGDDRLIWWFSLRSENLELQRQVGVFDEAPFGVAIVRENAIAVNRTLALMVKGDVETIGDLFMQPPRHSGEILRLAHPVERGRACRVFFDSEAPQDGTLVYLLLSTPEAERDSTSAEELLECLPVALARLTLDGRLISANAPARKLLGPRAQKDAMIGAMIEGLGRSISERVIEAARGRSSGRSEIARGKIEDRELFLQVSLSRLTIEGEPSLVAVISDATELKTLEAQFVQSQKMQAVGQLAGGVAHDFNNLLTAINGHCDLLLMRHETGDTDHADLTQIRQNANRAASLVRQMLAFSRKQTLRPKVLTLVETLSELSHLLNRLIGEKMQLKLEHQGDPWRVRVDERQFEQVIMNLVVNARDAMTEGGEVRIRTRNLRLEKSLNRDRATVPIGDYALVEVIDTGSGIPPDKIGNIFEPFYTTKKIGEGTGLGLSTAYGIIKQTGGFIFADSEPGAGATFSIYLPRHLSVDREEEEKPVEREANVNDLTGDEVVLLVEDEAPVRSFASRALKMRGYTVFEADSAEAALDLLKPEDLHIDVIVSDVVMPGMDGPTWVRDARERRPDVKVIFVSGYAEDAFQKSLQGMDDFLFLPKPYTLNELTQAIRTAAGDDVGQPPRRLH